MFLLHFALLCCISWSAMAQTPSPTNPTCETDGNGNNISKVNCSIDGVELYCGVNAVGITVYEDSLSCEADKVDYTNCAFMPPSYNCQKYIDYVNQATSYERLVGEAVVYDKCQRQLHGLKASDTNTIKLHCTPQSDAPSKSPTTITPSETPTRSPLDSSSPTRNPTASPSGTPTGSPSRTPTASPSKTPTASPSGTPTAAPSSNPTASPIDSDSPTASPTNFEKVTAELFCRAAKTKKNCKQALTQKQGKCKWKSGKKGSNNGVCKLKTYNAPVNCGTLTKRQCKKAVKKGDCVAADAKGHTCRSKSVE